VSLHGGPPPWDHVTTSQTTLRAYWTATDPESGIKRYEYRIRERGGNLARDWTDVGQTFDVTATGLSLAPCGRYLFDVRATNYFDLVSDVGSSAAILVFTYDVNGDGFVDQLDFRAFAACAGSPNIPYPPDPALGCARFDVDLDGDVDQTDFAAFQRCLSGGQPTNLACVE
jgi:hypothetical protein